MGYEVLVPWLFNSWRCGFLFSFSFLFGLVPLTNFGTRSLFLFRTVSVFTARRDNHDLVWDIKLVYITSVELCQETVLGLSFGFVGIIRGNIT